MAGAIYRCCLRDILQPCNFKMLFVGKSHKFISLLSHRHDKRFIRIVVMELEEIWIGDYLPTVYEVAQTIFHYAKGTKTKKTKKWDIVIGHYTTSLRNELRHLVRNM